MFFKNLFLFACLFFLVNLKGMSQENYNFYDLLEAVNNADKDKVEEILKKDPRLILATSETGFDIFYYLNIARSFYESKEDLRDNILIILEKYKEIIEKNIKREKECACNCDIF